MVRGMSGRPHFALERGQHRPHRNVDRAGGVVGREQPRDRVQEGQARQRRQVAHRRL